MKKNLVPVTIALLFIGAAALWYFGHHLPAQQILNAEPKKIYGVTMPALTDRDSITQTEVDPSTDPTPKPRAVKVDVETENTNNTSTPVNLDAAPPQETDRALNSDILSEEPVRQASVSDEAKAFETFRVAKSAYGSALKTFKSALTPPVDPGVLKSATKSLSEARRQRTIALRNLAVYSEEARQLLREVEAASAEAEARIAELEETEAEVLAAEIELVNEALELIEGDRSPSDE